ncbi:MAG TPA: glycosyltransferase [Burkholderiales bacterium]|nr:glycosyltransferase [Burkholderiales bacterium]
MSEELPGRIAVVHDWLVDFAGSESVLAEILRCLPQADLFTLVDHMPERERAPLGGRPARTSFLQDMPGVARHLAWYLPLMPVAIEQLDVTAYDLVVSSSHAVAKGVIVHPDALHLSYVHSPMRYAWDRQFDYLRAEGAERGLKSLLMRGLLHRLRLWDHRSAAGVDHFAANSAFVARRIAKCYRREAEVIAPPVDTEYFTPGGARSDEYLAVSRLVGYKRVDLLVQAFRDLPDRRLVIVGDGPDYKPLKAAAGPNVEFAGHVERAQVRAHLQRARAFLFAGVEDFGIAPVEAMACGTPVIAFGRGGAAETVAGLDAPAPTGVLFAEQSAAAVAAAVREFEASAGRIDPAACRARAEAYAPERFRSSFLDFVRRKRAEWTGRWNARR